MPMTRDEKDDFHSAWVRAHAKMMQLTGAFKQTHDADRAMKELLEVAIDDALFCNCGGCDDPIWESEMEKATSGEDGWFCADCISSWNDPANVTALEERIKANITKSIAEQDKSDHVFTTPFVVKKIESARIEYAGGSGVHTFEREFWESSDG